MTTRSGKQTASTTAARAAGWLLEGRRLTGRCSCLSLTRGRDSCLPLRAWNVMCSRGRNVAMRVLSVLGMILSSYAVYVEHKISEQRANPQSLGDGEAPFVALCDLGGWASCSDVLSSPSSRLFGPSNASLGVLFYAVIMLYPSVTFVPFREELLMAATAFSCVSAHSHTHACANTHMRDTFMQSGQCRPSIDRRLVECNGRFQVRLRAVNARSDSPAQVCSPPWSQ